MFLYTAYSRSGTAVVVSSILYTIGGFFLLGLLLDELPALEDLLVLSLFVIVLPMCYCLAMLTSKSKLEVAVREDKLTNHVVSSSFSSPKLIEVPFVSVRNIYLKNSMMAGSYILLELAHGLTVKLYSKQFFFTRNNSFYEMFLVIHKAVEGMKVLPINESKHRAETNGELTTEPTPDPFGKQTTAENSGGPISLSGSLKTAREKTKAKRIVYTITAFFCLFTLAYIAVMSFVVENEILRVILMTLFVFLEIGGVIGVAFLIRWAFRKYNVNGDD